MPIHPDNPEAIVIRFRSPDRLTSLVDWVKDHSDGATIDSSSKTITIYHPDDIFLTYLDNGGIIYVYL
jgi:hypothetical protein